MRFLKGMMIDLFVVAPIFLTFLNAQSTPQLPRTKVRGHLRFSVQAPQQAGESRRANTKDRSSTRVEESPQLAGGFFNVQAGSPDAKAAQMHVQSMVDEGEQMMSHGDQGHLDVMIRHAEAMQEHAKAAMEAAPSNDMHGKKVMECLKEAIGHLDEAIVHARRVHGDAAMAHAKKAMAHAREGAKHANEM